MNLTTPTTAPTTALAILFLASAAFAAGCSGGGHTPPAIYRSGSTVPVRVGTSLETARADHAISGIGSGQILVTGGEAADGRVLATAEILDTRTARSRALGVTLTRARAGHAQFTLPSGDVLIAGGRDASGAATDRLELYRVQDDRFEALPQRLAHPRDGAAAAITTDTFALAGGRDQTTLEVWSLAPLQRRALVQIPGAPRVGADLVPINAETYLLYGGGGAPLWIDLATGTTLPVVGELAQRATALAAPGGGAAWLIGGVFGADSINREVQQISPSKDPVFVASGPDHRRERPVVVSDPASGTVSVFGGRLNGFPVQESEQVAPSKQPLPPLPGQRERMAGLIAPDGVIALVGGRDADGRASAHVDLILPPGAAARDGEGAYRDAATERAAEVSRSQDIADSAANLSSAEQRLARVRADLKQTEATLDRVEANTLRAEGELKQTQAATQAALAKARALRTDLRAKEQQLKQAQAQNAADLATIQRLETEVTVARQATSRAAQDADRLKAASDALLIKVNHTKAQIGALQARKAGLVARL